MLAELIPTRVSGTIVIVPVLTSVMLKGIRMDYRHASLLVHIYHVQDLELRDNRLQVRSALGWAWSIGMCLHAGIFVGPDLRISNMSRAIQTGLVETASVSEMDLRYFGFAIAVW